MEFVDPEDEPHPFRDPPLPDDRIWRHPSEMGPKRTPVRRQLWVVGITAAVAASLLSTGLAVVLGTVFDEGSTGSGGNRATLVSLPARSTAGANGDVVQIAEHVRPAIAQLRVAGAPGTTAGSGSGVVFRSDGEVLTNAHVVDGASSVTVVLSSGRELPGQVVGSDPDSDTAVVKIDGGPFPFAELGTAADLKVGQQAIAMGSPLGLSGGPSVTVGVVSALHRSVATRNSTRVLMDMVQTDAPIAPGSSGGALVDSGGRVIGITTAVAVSDTGTDGFGFATPIDVARSSAEQLVATGRVANAWLGVEGSDLDAPSALDLSVAGGARVDRVVVDSPAEHAGVAARDVIVGVDGRAVMSVGMLVVAVRGHRPGDVVTLDVMRDHEHRAMKATVVERPPDS
ncbi:MAG TPA: trypsin-like peptidase domain-containing protein [Acidimicrobiales bacterium]|nr:trypsin-like peptidase domain-containing protein [Acidimicrobiales bacterium]